MYKLNDSVSWDWFYILLNKSNKLIWSLLKQYNPQISWWVYQESYLNPGWHIILFKYDGESVYLYLDWILQYKNTYTSWYDKTTLPLYLWWRNAGRYFNWIIDEFRIYDYALSDSEISALYNASK
jgi:hypothetical protein